MTRELHAMGTAHFDFMRNQFASNFSYGTDSESQRRNSLSGFIAVLLVQLNSTYLHFDNIA